MLVLSRREGETLVFPELEIVLEVLAVKGSTTRLGIQAPAKIRVLRGELAQSRTKLDTLVENVADDPSGKLMHRIRNWLHTANLRMQLIRRYMQSDQLEAAADLIQRVLEDFKNIEGVEQPLLNSAPVSTVMTSTTAAVEHLNVSSPSTHPSRRALLVEDNDNERQLLAAYLSEHGFQVATAGDGCAALDYLSHSALPDLVLLDMLMPKCDGPAVLRSIRGNQTFHHLKVFAVSGTSQTKCNIPTGPDGVDRWFRKPVDPQYLVREILHDLGEEESEGHREAAALAASS